MSLKNIQDRMAHACLKAGRPTTAVQLVAVSKFQPYEKIVSILELGHRLFGESRVQETAEKWPALREKFPDIELHCIGRLQTNKVKDAIRLFDMIQTVDREKLAEALREEMHGQKRELPCLLQVNTGDEERKGGVAPENLEKLYRFCTEEARLEIRGLMCIPPQHEIPDLHFALLRKLAQSLGLRDLSMGMSDDFETAIRYGATYIRVGSALFGVRET